MIAREISAIGKGQEQVAALCWRSAPVLEVLLVTTLRTRRWIRPKGWPQPGLTLSQSAANEALEEAGVIGNIDPAAIGSYRYAKEKGSSALLCRVRVFPLEVTGHRRTWPEKGARELAWLPLEQAALRVAEPGLKHLLLTFRKAHIAA